MPLKLGLDHVHMYVQVRGEKGQRWRCNDPDCYHIVLRRVVEGKRSRCACGNTFILDPQALKRVYPKCMECSNTAEARAHRQGKSEGLLRLEENLRELEASHQRGEIRDPMEIIAESHRLLVAALPDLSALERETAEAKLQVGMGLTRLSILASTLSASLDGLQRGKTTAAAVVESFRQLYIKLHKMPTERSAQS